MICAFLCASSAFLWLITRWIALDVDVGDRGDAGGFQGGFHRRSIADDHDRQVIQVDVVLRDAQYIFLRHRRDVLRVLLVVIIRQTQRHKRSDRVVN